MDDNGKKRDELIAELAVLREERGFSDRIMRRMPAIIGRVAPDGTTLYLNPAGEEATGYRSHELVGKNWWRTMYPGNEYCQVERLFQGLQNGDVRDYEMVLTTRNGAKRTIIWNSINHHDDKGMVTEIVGFGTDITDRKKAEEALRQSELSLQVIIEATADGILAVDSNGKTIRANRRFADLWRIPHGIMDTGDDEAMLRYVLDQLVDPEAFLTKVKVLYGTADEDMDELHFKDDRVFERYSAPLLLNGAVVGRVWSFRDVTARRHAEEAQKQLEAERLKLQKLESVGVLAGGIAHDFNNLLQGVFGYISMAKAGIGTGETAIDLLEQAEQALKTSINLTTQLLTFAKGGQPVRKRLAPVPVVENAAKFALSGSRSAYRLKPAKGLWQVFADEGQIGQVLQNIVLNAHEAMPDGGTVEISLTNRDIRSGEHHSLTGGGKFVRIDIEDSGTGIPARYLSRVFDPYFTTKEKGSGLGLATSFAIARNHGGTLEVVSEPGRGSTFSFYLPACDGAGEVGKRPIAASTGKKGRILVMDDEEVVLLAVTRMVRLLGHEVEWTENGEGAVAKYREARDGANPFDVVILDLTIKGGAGGEEVAGKMLKIDQAARIIVSSGYSDNQILSDYRSYGFSACLAKPYTMEALRDTLNEMLT